MNSLLTMEEALTAVEDVLEQRARGQATNHPRTHDIAGPGIYLAAMRAAAPELGVYGFKAYTAVAGTFRFFVYLYDSNTSELLAIVQANRLGQLRTGAATGVATRYMAREDSTEVGIIGSGYQAGTQLEAVCRVRPITRARVYSPTPEHRTTFAREMSRALGIDVTPAETSRQAVEGVDILITISASRTPVFDGTWLEPGMHVVAVGGANEYVRELDDAAIQRADLLVVDDIAQARVECGELMIPAASGLILWEQLCELWQVVGGEVTGRSTPHDVTLFKSLGMALWDVAVAKVAYDKAMERGVGTRM